MASTFTANLGLEIPATGDVIDWGLVFAANMQKLDKLASGNVPKNGVASPYALTVDEALAGSYEFTIAADSTVIIPNNFPPRPFENINSGGFILTVKTAAGLGVSIGPGKALIYANGINAEEIVQPGVLCRMNAAATQALATTAATKVVLGTAAHNVGGNVADTANNRITIKIPGAYSIRAHLRGLTTAAVQGLTSQIYKNGVAIGPANSGYNPAAAASHISTSNEVTDTCVAGDYFEVYANASLAGGVTLQASDNYLVVEKE